MAAEERAASLDWRLLRRLLRPQLHKNARPAANNEALIQDGGEPDAKEPPAERPAPRMRTASQDAHPVAPLGVKLSSHFCAAALPPGKGWLRLRRRNGNRSGFVPFQNQVVR
ncbi:hypothetical protein HispidOSU_023897 [Sigmodon hispidus]